MFFHHVLKQVLSIQDLLSSHLVVVQKIRYLLMLEKVFKNSYEYKFASMEVGQ